MPKQIAILGVSGSAGGASAVNILPAQLLETRRDPVATNRAIFETEPCEQQKICP